MKVELFEIDPQTRLAELNRPWISTIKEFKKVLSRDRGSEGDLDGRRKLQATREFTFIYHFCDYASKYDNYSEEDKLGECIRNSELPTNFDYKKDAVLVEAVKRYLSMQKSAALELLNEAKEGLHTAHRVIRKTRIALETQLAAIDMDEVDEEEPEDEEFSGNPKFKKKKVDDPITKITKALGNLMIMTNQIGPALKNIKELEADVKQELGDKAALRGGKEKGTKEDAVPAQQAVPTSIFD